MIDMQQAVSKRYGIPACKGIYNSERSQSPIETSKPLYNPLDNTDRVEEHGRWCRARCVSAANEARIDEILEAHRSAKHG